MEDACYSQMIIVQTLKTSTNNTSEHNYNPIDGRVADEPACWIVEMIQF